MNRSHSPWCCLLVIGIVTALPGASASAAGEKKPAKAIDHSSPQKIADEFTQAMKHENWERAFRCVTDKSRMTLVAVATFAAAVGTVNDKAREKSLKALTEKHGPLKPDDVSNVKKMAAMFGDLQMWLSKNLPKVNGKPQQSMGRQFGNATYKNFQVKGSVATADVYQNGRKSPTAAYFKKIKGKWYFDAYEAARHSKSGFKFNIKKK